MEKRFTCRIPPEILQPVELASQGSSVMNYTDAQLINRVESKVAGQRPEFPMVVSCPTNAGTYGLLHFDLQEF